MASKSASAIRRAAATKSSVTRAMSASPIAFGAPHRDRTESRCRRPPPMSGGGGDRAGMTELGADLGSGGVHGGRQLAQAGYGVVGHDELARRTTGVARHRAERDGGETDAALGDCEVVVDQPIGRNVLRRHAFERGRLDDAVAQRDRTEPRRCERVGGHGVRRYTCPPHKGLIGFDVETGSRTCDRSCSDSLNGATNRSAKSDFALAA